MGVSINGCIQNWLVYFMENPTKMDDDWGYPHFRNLHMPSIYQPQASPKRSSFRSHVLPGRSDQRTFRCYPDRTATTSCCFCIIMLYRIIFWGSFMTSYYFKTDPGYNVSPSKQLHGCASQLQRPNRTNRTNTNRSSFEP